MSFVDIDRALLGREFDRASYGPIELDEILAYARLIGEQVDASDPVAPPSFVVKLRGDRALPDFVVQQLRSGGFDAGKDIEFGADIRPGDVLSVATSVHDIYEKTGRSGSMVFLVLRTVIRNQRGELVAYVDQRMMQKGA